MGFQFLSSDSGQTNLQMAEEERQKDLLRQQFFENAFDVNLNHKFCQPLSENQKTRLQDSFMNNEFYKHASEDDILIAIADLKTVENAELKDLQGPIKTI